MDQDTIAAIATPFGSGGIGIVRVSGTDAQHIASKIFLPKASSHSKDTTSPPKINELKSHRLYLGHILDFDQNRIDEVLLTVMRAPNSYTCEDVVEIQAHSGPIILKTILNLTISHGARIARPGEFTQRAFLNGRIDLTQAEAICDLINAKTEHALQLANSQMKGRLRHEIEKIKNNILNVSMNIEAAIDFPDEMGEELNLEVLAQSLIDNVQSPINLLIEKHDAFGFIREGLRIAIVGAPNVGKSSLMNCLLNQERSIVTDFPGTTRDIVEDSFQLNGIPLIVSDTAGIHQTTDPIESIGIKKTHHQIQNSDLILYVIDACKMDISPYTSSESAEGSPFTNALQSKQQILVFNKIDLIHKKLMIDAHSAFKGLPYVYISALYKKGIDELKEQIVTTVFGQQLDTTAAIIPNLRHRLNLKKCSQSVQTAISLLKSNAPAEIISIELSTATDHLDELLGETIKTDILDLIFNEFCIGK